VQEDGKLIDRLTVQSGDLRARYLQYLLDQNRTDLTGPAVDRLLADRRQADVPLLLTACERLLNDGRGVEAAEIWNALAKPGTAPKENGGENGQMVVNGAFAVSPTSRGLDWRLPSIEGVSVARERDSGGLRVTFSGREPEECDALVQMIPLKDHVPYQLAFVYRTEGIANGAGLFWRVTDAQGVLLAESTSLASPADTEGRMQVYAPPGLVRLALRYRRAPGTTRAEGFLILHNVALRRAAPLSPTAQLLMDGGRVRK